MSSNIAEEKKEYVVIVDNKGEILREMYYNKSAALSTLKNNYFSKYFKGLLRPGDVIIQDTTLVNNELLITFVYATEQQAKELDNLPDIREIKILFPQQVDKYVKLFGNSGITSKNMVRDSIDKLTRARALFGTAVVASVPALSYLAYYANKNDVKVWKTFKDINSQTESMIKGEKQGAEEKTFTYKAAQKIITQKPRDMIAAPSFPVVFDTAASEPFRTALPAPQKSRKKELVANFGTNLFAM